MSICKQFDHNLNKGKTISPYFAYYNMETKVLQETGKMLFLSKSIQDELIQIEIYENDRIDRQSVSFMSFYTFILQELAILRKPKFTSQSEFKSLVRNYANQTLILEKVSVKIQEIESESQAIIFSNFILVIASILTIYLFCNIFSLLSLFGIKKFQLKILNYFCKLKMKEIVKLSQIHRHLQIQLKKVIDPFKIPGNLEEDNKFNQDMKSNTKLAQPTLSNSLQSERFSVIKQSFGLYFIITLNITFFVVFVIQIQQYKTTISTSFNQLETTMFQANQLTNTILSTEMLIFSSAEQLQGKKFSLHIPITSIKNQEQWNDQFQASKKQAYLLSKTLSQIAMQMQDANSEAHLKFKELIYTDFCLQYTSSLLGDLQNSSNLLIQVSLRKQVAKYKLCNGGSVTQYSKGMLFAIEDIMILVETYYKDLTNIDPQQIDNIIQLYQSSDYQMLVVNYFLLLQDQIDSVIGFLQQYTIENINKFQDSMNMYFYSGGVLLLVFQLFYMYMYSNFMRQRIYLLKFSLTLIPQSMLVEQTSINLLKNIMKQ